MCFNPAANQQPPWPSHPSAQPAYTIAYTKSIVSNLQIFKSPSEGATYRSEGSRLEGHPELPQTRGLYPSTPNAIAMAVWIELVPYYPFDIMSIHEVADASNILPIFASALSFARWRKAIFKNKLRKTSDFVTARQQHTSIVQIKQSLHICYPEWLPYIYVCWNDILSMLIFSKLYSNYTTLNTSIIYIWTSKKYFN